MEKVELLVITDKSDVAEVIRRNVAEANIIFHHSDSSSVAEKILNNTLFNIIIIDFNSKNNINLCKSIRNSTRNDFYPFIFALVDVELKSIYTDLIESQCDDFLQTPLDSMEVGLRLKLSLFSVRNRVKRLNAENELIKAKIHREVVLNSLNLGTVLLDQEGKILYFNSPMQNLCAYQLKVGEPFLKCLQASSEYIMRLENWLENPKGKFVVNTVNKWFELEYYSDEYNDTLLYAVDITELMLLKINKYGRDGIIGESIGIKKVLSQISLLAAGDWNVLIEGETGTGKELVARDLFIQSRRRDKAFLIVNCAGLTESLATSILFGHKKGAFTGALSDHEGYFEAADGGTIFLDEIGDISPVIQVMLLRAIEQKEIVRVGENKVRNVDVRIIAASNKNLEQEVKKGRFRDDLFYRLNESIITVPPLRERKDDIPLLLEHFMSRNRLKYPELSGRLSNESLKLLVNYDWPGNVRQLRSVIQFAAIQAEGEIIKPKDIQLEIRESSERYFRKSGDKEEIIKALKASGGNYSKASAVLGISRATLYRKIKKYGIKE